MQAICVILQLAVIILRYWLDPNRLAQELEAAKEAAYEKSLNAFREAVARRDGDAVAVALADRLRQLRAKRTNGGNPAD